MRPRRVAVEVKTVVVAREVVAMGIVPPLLPRLPTRDRNIENTAGSVETQASGRGRVKPWLLVLQLHKHSMES